MRAARAAAVAIRAGLSACARPATRRVALLATLCAAPVALAQSAAVPPPPEPAAREATAADAPLEPAALQAVYRISRRFTTEAAGLTAPGQSLPDQPEDQHFELSLCLAPELNVIGVGAERSRFDYARGRVVHEALDGSGWDEGSLHEQPSEALVELAGRLGTAASFREAGWVEDSAGLLLSYQPFELFCLYGHVLDPEEIAPGARLEAGPSPALELHGNGGALRHGEEAVLQWEVSEHVLPAGLRRAWGRAVVRQVRSHPLALEALAAQARLPGTLRFRYRSDGTLVREEWELLSVGTCAPAAAERQPGTPRVRRMSAALAAVLAAARAPQPDSDALARAQAAFEASRWLEGFLATWSHAMRTGADTRALLHAQGPALAHDARLTALFGALAATDEQGAEEGLAALDELLATRPNGWRALRIGRAELLFRLGRFDEAEQQFHEALRDEPDLAGVLKDLGDLYWRGARIVEAWACWDRLAEIVPGHPFLADITGLRERLREEFPRMY